MIGRPSHPISPSHYLPFRPVYSVSIYSFPSYLLLSLFTRVICLSHRPLPYSFPFSSVSSSLSLLLHFIPSTPVSAPSRYVPHFSHRVIASFECSPVSTYLCTSRLMISTHRLASLPSPPDYSHLHLTSPHAFTSLHVVLLIPLTSRLPHPLLHLIPPSLSRLLALHASAPLINTLSSRVAPILIHV